MPTVEKIDRAGSDSRFAPVASCSMGAVVMNIVPRVRISTAVRLGPGGRKLLIVQSCRVGIVIKEVRQYGLLRQRRPDQLSPDFTAVHDIGAVGQVKQLGEIGGDQQHS